MEKRFGLEHRLRKANKRFNLGKAVLSVAAGSAMSVAGYLMSTSQGCSPAAAAEITEDCQASALEQRVYKHTAHIVDKVGTNILTKDPYFCGKQVISNDIVYAVYQRGQENSAMGVYMQGNPLSEECDSIWKLYKNEHRKIFIASFYENMTENRIISVVQPELLGPVKVIEKHDDRTRTFVRNPDSIQAYFQRYVSGILKLIETFGTDYPLPEEYST